MFTKKPYNNLKDEISHDERVSKVNTVALFFLLTALAGIAIMVFQYFYVQANYSEIIQTKEMYQ